MKILYLDCGMGAAGDMLTSALLELLPDRGSFVDELNSLGIPGVTFKPETSFKCGIKGTHMSVLVNGVELDESRNDAHHEHHAHHHSSNLGTIEERISSLPLNSRVRDHVLEVYRLIAEAESEVHGVSVQEIHFHEVGTLDAIADVVAVCLLMDRISPDEVIVSPVHVGTGQVHAAHGILPVPAPATAVLLKGVPIYGGEIYGELCTPTGAALLRHFATRFGTMPVMQTSAIGYGMGMKDFPRANCVRAILGEGGDGRDRVSVLSCNVDDMTAEEIGFATEKLLSGGAWEVYTVAVGMKKNRPGNLIRVICSSEDKERMAGLIFRLTSTIGIREMEMNRFILDRQMVTRQTSYGDIRFKRVSGYGIKREKAEYDDVSRVASMESVSISEARKLIERDLDDK